MPGGERCWRAGPDTIEQDQGPRRSSVLPVLGADAIVDAEIEAPTTGAFNVIGVGIVEPHAKAILPGLLSRVVFNVVVDGDLPF
jgi:hypothetical protein